MSTESEIIFGFTLDTALPEPINSGGSIAIISGFNLAIDSTSSIDCAQTSDVSSSSLNLSISF